MGKYDWSQPSVLAPLFCRCGVHFPEQLKGVDIEDFYLAANKVENSLIRIEADELTYNLHIIIRYEIEKKLFNEGLAVKDLPETWNAKYKEYLGIMPPNDGMGVLQDVHWSGGDFGYFASYSLGNMYAAQFLYDAQKNCRISTSSSKRTCSDQGMADGQGLQYGKSESRPRSSCASPEKN